MSTNLIIAAALLFVLAYLPSVWLGLRRKKLQGVVRWFFAVTILPVFVGLMWLNLWVMNHVIPVEKIISRARGFDERHEGLATALSLFGIDIEVEPLVAFAVAAPIAALLAWLWYQLLVWLDRFRKTRHNSSRSRA